MLEQKAALHDLGRVVYGLAGIALGIIGLVWRDFAAVWQPLENLGAASHRAVIAVVFPIVIYAVFEIGFRVSLPKSFLYDSGILPF